jgi:hypothetical protein
VFSLQAFVRHARIHSGENIGIFTILVCNKCSPGDNLKRTPAGCIKAIERSFLREGVCGIGQICENFFYLVGLAFSYRDIVNN